MKLTDKEYYLLNVLTAIQMSDNQKKGTVKEIVSSLLEKTEENATQDNLPEDVLTFLHQILNNDTLCNLHLTAWEKLKDVEAYSFSNPAEEKIMIYTSHNQNLMDALQLILNEDATHLEEGLTFLKTYKGDQPYTVSGYSIGGAYAIYAVANEGCNGVVFDAPGIGNRLRSERKQTLQVKNYIAYNSFLSAIGEHTENVAYAKSESGEFLPNNSWDGKFSFDKEGQVITGEAGEHFLLLSKLNIISAKHSQGLEEVMNAFAETVQLDETLFGNVGVMLLTILDKLEEGQVRSTITEIEKRFDRKMHEHYVKCRKDFQNLQYIQEINEMQNKIFEVMELTMQEVTKTVETYYQPVEALLSILALYSMQNTNLLNEIEVSLESYAEFLDKKMSEIGDKVTNEIDILAEGHINSLTRFMDINER